MGISIWQLLILLAIVLLLFGTKKLRNLGGDLGGALQGFKKALNEDTPPKDNALENATETEKVSTETVNKSDPEYLKKD